MAFLKMHDCYKQTCTFKKEVYKGKLCKHTAKRSKLRNVYLKYRSEESDKKDNTFSEDEKIAETFN